MAAPKGTRPPGGSRKGRPNKATADIKALAQKYCPAAMDELARLSVHAESEQARVAAIKELFDRGYGKAPQAIEHSVTEGFAEMLVKARERAKQA